MPPELDQPEASTEETPEGATELAPEGDSFDALELYDESEAAESQAKETTTPKEEVQETPPVEPTPVDPIYELEGYGQIRASQMRAALASQEKYSDIEQEIAKLDTERERLDTFRTENANAIQMVSMTQIPAIRTAMQQAIADVLTSEHSLDVQPDGRGQQFFDNLPQQLQSEAPPEQEQSPEIQELQSFKAETEINSYFAEIHSQHPEVVTQELADEIVKQSVALYDTDADRNRMGIREVRLVGNALLNAKLAESGSNDREVVEAMEQLPAGAVVVTGGGNRAAVTQAAPKDPRTMEWGELESELGDELYMEADA